MSQWIIVAVVGVAAVVGLIIFACRHMSTIGNIIWFILGGWWNFLLYGFLGVLCCITIIGIPVGKALFQYAKLMVLPFGKEIVRETDIKGKENVSAIRRVGGVIANIIWLPVGLVMFVGNILLAVVTAITIVGIPAAIVLARSAKFLIWPVGARVITKQEAEALQMRKTMTAAMGNGMFVNQAMMPGQGMPQSVPQPMPIVSPQPVPVVSPQPVQGAQAAPYTYTAAATAQSAPQPTASVPVKRFCSQCGTECTGGARFCPKCGTKVG